ncbi:SDR family oxidoreductase [Paenarthrobacter nicotinovorans]|uniref:SDR family oxidoreductase n=1 Tax=Paenarthrobacter nicotinovorans TaxID=29320 RepID=A0ABV0GZ60_PAENI|nr:SDR family oxidoreductase [Paenarthrobacter nicotinovorans]
MQEAKVVVVTGAGSGLGAAIADTFAGQGATVVRGDIRYEGERDSRLFLDLDVADSTSWEDFASSVERRFGAISVLVNNAGVSIRTDLLRTSDEKWDQIIRTNLWAPWKGIKVFSPQLQQTNGTVINVGSIYGETVPPMTGELPASVAYQVSKAGLHRLTKVAAVELATMGIRVNAVMPGVFRTPLLEDLPDSEARLRIAGAPMNRAGQVQELAAAVAFLASNESSFVTGALLPVDGGYLAAS